MLLDVHGHAAYCYTGGKSFDAVLPTAVFIHGAQHDHSVWILQTRYFAHHGFGVLAIDLPGHGRSKGAPLATVEAMADWLLAVLDAAGVTRAILIGHSMGSLIALETARRAPARVDKLALLACAYPMKVSDALLEAALHDEPRAIDMVNVWSHSGIAQKPSSPGPGFSVTGGNQRLMQRLAAGNPAALFHTDFVACNSYAQGMEAAAAVTCPTLFLLGQQDQMTPARASAALIAAIPAARVERLASCGHALMAEQPDAVLASLFGFAGLKA
ncbi:alpha/beta hydrolase [Actimicrobium sp. CCI2.3]|uniref:alpha/beta fold hydrolase n=1 Tax=Actimicrobium sp. CCI2.3 TaxID=3048616 RepID=UPI002AB442E2|nr:alpha/beta hydrolase [Actimicrobium sp. CCI2.3]MDY7575272.1 alpha/beta hydrolase [Actimicrobium sp. CCI2.3]MEB0023139.1 alpha/beta hydrolase [Actimicrobium sp. CCI2.3]